MCHANYSPQIYFEGIDNAGHLYGPDSYEEMKVRSDGEVLMTAMLTLIH